MYVYLPLSPTEKYTWAGICLNHQVELENAEYFLNELIFQRLTDSLLRFQWTRCPWHKCPSFMTTPRVKILNTHKIKVMLSNGFYEEEPRINWGLHKISAHIFFKYSSSSTGLYFKLLCLVLKTFHSPGLSLILLFPRVSPILGHWAPTISRNTIHQHATQQAVLLPAQPNQSPLHSHQTLP